mgnify:CR=1 FL=1
MPRPRQNKRLKDKLPEAFKACRNGWVIDESTANEPFDIITEVEFDDQSTDALAETYRNVAKAMTRQLQSQGKEVNSVNAHQEILSDMALLVIIQHTNEQLTANGHPATNVREYRRFLHHKNIASRFNLSPEMTWDQCMPGIATKHSFPLMELGRFREILNNTRGFSIQERTGDNEEDTWFQRNEVLKKCSRSCVQPWN